MPANDTAPLALRPRSILAKPQKGEVITPAFAMRLALQEATKGAGFVSPNPLVGCTLVDADHGFLAVGYHHRLGQDHAEIDALRQLPSPETLRGGHVYVTLEPCAHHGRTPSCAKTLAPLAPASVTYAVADPNPVAENGARILSAAGVLTRSLGERLDIEEHERLELISEAEDLAEVFLHVMRVREPFITVKVASSLDGQMALSSGESKWITGEAAREHTHLLRARYDAVLIGRNTFVADNPSLNVRHPLYPQFENRAVLLDPEARTLSDLKMSNLFQVRTPEKLAVVVRRGLAPEMLAQAPAGVQILEVDLDSGGHDFQMQDLLRALQNAQIHSVMVEGGAQTYASFFKAKKVQRLHHFEAPVLIGGQHGLAWSARFGVDQMAHRMKLARVERRIFGSDVYTSGRLVYD